MTARSGSVPVEGIQLITREADQGLLRDTIGILEADWRAPSLLPGWTRAHVATHLARGADRLREFTQACLAGETPPDVSAETRFAELERGAERNSLELQIDLDTSATALTTVWHAVTDWHRPVRFLGRTRPLATLPLVRLHEVFVHHIDLDCGFTADQVPAEAAAWLLPWVAARVQDADLPAIAVEGDSGFAATIGRGPVTAVAQAGDAKLWAWLSGRARLADADLPLLPLLA